MDVAVADLDRDVLFGRALTNEALPKIDRLKDSRRCAGPIQYVKMQTGHALFDQVFGLRDPLPNWSRGRVTLLGDACHPMMPFMAQGAGQAIEDAVVLARAVYGVSASEIETALENYEAARKERTAKIGIFF